MYRRKPHPRLSVLSNAVYDYIIARYVRGYERAYPHTRSDEFRRWLEGRLGRRLEEVEPEGGAT